MLEFVALCFGFGLFRIGVCQLFGDSLLPFINSIENGLVQESLQQPHQNEEIDDLRKDGKPIDQHMWASINAHFIPTAALRKKFLAGISIHMRRGEIFPAPCIWANSEFLEAPIITFPQ